MTMLRFEDLMRVVPFSVQLLFVRVDKSVLGWGEGESCLRGIDADDFLGGVADCFRKRGSHIGMWAFALIHDTDVVSWQMGYVDFFSPLLDKRRWRDPAELVRGMCLTGLRFVVV